MQGIIRFTCTIIIVILLVLIMMMMVAVVVVMMAVVVVMMVVMVVVVVVVMMVFCSILKKFCLNLEISSSEVKRPSLPPFLTSFFVGTGVASKRLM